MVVIDLLNRHKLTTNQKFPEPNPRLTVMDGGFSLLIKRDKYFLASFKKSKIIWLKREEEKKRSRIRNEEGREESLPGPEEGGLSSKRPSKKKWVVITRRCTWKKEKNELLS